MGHSGCSFVAFGILAQQLCSAGFAAAARARDGINIATSAQSINATSIRDIVLTSNATNRSYFLITPHDSISLPSYGFEIFSEVCSQLFFAMGQ